MVGDISAPISQYHQPRLLSNSGLGEGAKVIIRGIEGNKLGTHHDKSKSSVRVLLRWRHQPHYHERIKVNGHDLPYPSLQLIRSPSVYLERIERGSSDQDVLRSLLPLAGLCAQIATADRQVFAHYIVGLTSGQTRDQWQVDISQAKASGIDGFALNIGSQDNYNDAQLHLAYDVASSNGFSLFLSFDMQASHWEADQIISYINTYKGFTSQFRVNNLPVVSTFEGPSQANIWPGVRAATGGIFFMPDWASLGAHGVGDKLSLIDGAFNWGAWPEANQLTMSTGNDVAYKSVLNNKPYMMGVSPYFYTNLPAFNKNWYSSSDSLWFDRWKQVFDINPAYIEIITWNDYGESSYINAPISRQIVAGAETYVAGFDHSAFRFVLPYFISAYKAGNPNVAVPREGALAWYRTTPATICSNGGKLTTGKGLAQQS
ncbi:hypothetical protein NUW58_g9180 [Xylaria curta]|uniref:Uncharacterized protein n=1 Tax=Xylaria curta TaxID=42375 RepID=A0ACC1N0V2_9PEZI|nr:hypothetical protein NUW58_g9180 [Xylaria curta]